MGHNFPVKLAFLEQLSSVHLAALWLVNIALNVGTPTGDEYSNYGRTSVSYAISHIAWEFVLMNPRNQLADVHIFWM